MKIFKEFLYKDFTIPLIASFIIGSGIAYNKFRLYHLVALLSLPHFLNLSKKINFKAPLTFFFSIFFVLSFASYFWAESFENYLQFNFCLLNGTYLAAYVVLASDNNSLHNLSTSLIKLNFITYIFCVFESLRIFHFPFNNSYEHFLMYKNGSSYLDPDSLYYLSSLPSFYFWNPNDLASYSVATMPLIFFIKSFRTQFILISLFLFLIFMNGSQVCTLVAILVATLQLFNKGISKRSRAISATTAVIALFFIFSSTTVLRGNIRKNRMNIMLQSAELYLGIKKPMDYKIIPGGTSTIRRKDLMKTGFTKFLQAPYLGSGAGNDLVSLPDEKNTNIHNFWLQILVQFGIVGFILSGICYIEILWELFKFKNHSGQNFFIFTIFIFHPILILSLSNAIYQPTFWIPIIFALLVIKKTKNELDPKSVEVLSVSS